MSIHNLRHSIASHLLEGGMPLQQVRQFLGHDQMETTEIYTHIQQRQIKKMIDDI
ncbi:MAG: tyrosine-type recombinase/integrase [Saprospiraceae bacterium]|nr:tyrosine-type recombinase/integrase [Candidatus Vicinibacter affinis]